MKTGYKGFNKDLISGLGYSAKKEQFVVGETYTKPNKSNPRMCSDDGYHYCNELTDVFLHHNPKSDCRFCEVEILGDFTDGSNQSITTSFKIIREISHDEACNKIYEKNLHLDLVKEIQIKYPMLHVGGSVGLYLHGVRLSRWLEKGSSDIDMVTPYFILPEGKIGDEDIEYYDGYPSANDFDETFRVGNVKIDYRIDPKQRYEIIEYNDFKFKVSPLFVIMEAKMRYALQKFGEKHKNDIQEMIVKIKPEVIKKIEPLPF